MFVPYIGDGNGGITVRGEGKSGILFVGQSPRGDIGDGRLSCNVPASYTGDGAVGKFASPGRYVSTGLTSCIDFSPGGASDEPVGAVSGGVYAGTGPCNCRSSFLLASS